MDPGFARAALGPEHIESLHHPRQQAMSDDQRQRISELQDGELESNAAARLLDALVSDPRLQGDWERYHLIGQVLRGEPVMVERRAIVAEVRQQLSAEPTILAPARLQGVRRGRLRPSTGMALAAAAAIFAVFVLPGLLNRSSLLAPVPPAAPTFAGQPSAGMPVTKRWDLDRPELVSKLDLYLVNHQENAPAVGAKGMLPYATLVGYEAGR
jgi:sigma-E factor negative regulatory protein RseA